MRDMGPATVTDNSINRFVVDILMSAWYITDTSYTTAEYKEND